MCTRNVHVIVRNVHLSCRSLTQIDNKFQDGRQNGGREKYNWL